MMSPKLRATLVNATALIAVAYSVSARAAETAEATATPENEQASSATRTGQANDAQSLTSSDIIVTGSRAAETAPITASLTTTQPQAAISRSFIDNSAVVTADFNELIKLTPGVSITGTGNGAGFSESKAQIRGFQDGEYNVTYDSIPFADTNNPTHHSTAFFPSNTLETIVVDRGPGNASQLGQASYGGNVNMYSRAVSDKSDLQMQLVGGTWNSTIIRGEVQTGRLENLGGAQFVVTGEYKVSDGALTYSPIASVNLFAKGVIPLGTNHVLTVLSTYNRNHYYQSDSEKGGVCGSALKGITGFSSAALDANGQLLTQLTGENCAATSTIGVYGKFYGLGNDATQQNYWQYNRTDKNTDFEIVRLQSNLGSGLSMDNRLYTYAYTNNTLSGKSGSVISGFVTTNPPVSASNPNGLLISPVTATGHVLGYDKLNKYRVWGYIGQVNYDFAFGKMRLGGWFEKADTDRHLYDLDRTNGQPSYNEKFNNGSGTAAALLLPASNLANIAYDQKSGWQQYQLFSEVEVRPTDSITITPGLKYVHFERSINATVNQTSRTPIDTSATWTRTLPFATINWQLARNWSAYGQYAQGMYVPDLSSFYSPSGTAADAATQAQKLSDLKPQTSTNYQIGTVWHGEKVSLDFDGYIINVNNKIAASTLATDPPGTLVNLGMVRYKGVEGQVSVMPLTGLTLLANASYNSAKSVSTGAQIAKTPFYTATLGVFYQTTDFRVSFTQKFIGQAYAKEFDGNPTIRLYRMPAYAIGDFAMSYDINRQVRLGVTVSNVFNSAAITSISNSATGAPTAIINGVSYQSGYGQSDAFAFLPPRSVMADIRVKF